VVPAIDCGPRARRRRDLLRGDLGEGGGMAVERPVVGWREWVLLPDLLDVPVKAKIDTGARTSSIHTFGKRTFVERGGPWVEFQIHPVQRQNWPEVACVAPVVDERIVKSSNGEVTRRLVIETQARIGDIGWPIELTLAQRDVMGFRMLLGRAALRGRFLVDPTRSFRQRTLPQETFPK
jgi:hypothetical protein